MGKGDGYACADKTEMLEAEDDKKDKHEIIRPLDDEVCQRTTLSKVDVA